MSGTGQKQLRDLGRIFKRGPVYWIAYCHRRREVRESAKTNEPQRAARRLRERLRSAGTPSGVGPQAERVSFEGLAALYLTDYGVNHRRSVRDARRSVRQLQMFFAEARAVDITSDRITAYVAAR